MMRDERRGWPLALSVIGGALASFALLALVVGAVLALNAQGRAPESAVPSTPQRASATPLPRATASSAPTPTAIAQPAPAPPPAPVVQSQNVPAQPPCPSGALYGEVSFIEQSVASGGLVDVTVRGWVRNDSTSDILLFRNGGPSVRGFDNTNEMTWVSGAQFEVSVPDTFLLAPGDSANWSASDSFAQDYIERTTSVYGTPEIPMVATWNLGELASCPGPILSATHSHGPRYSL